MLDAAEIDPRLARRRAARGVVLLAARMVATQACVLLGTIVLARLLDPADFGVFAVLQFALAFFQFFGDSGVAGALIQASDAPTERARANAFTIQALLAAVIVAAVWLVSPAVTLVWPKLPASSVTLLRAMSLTLLVSSLRVVPSIMLERRLRFGVIAAAEVVQAVVFYGTACACAYAGLRAWTWPAALLAQAVAGVIVICAAEPWRPALALDGAILKPLLRFGLPFQLKNVIGFANGAVTPLYAGAALGPAAVGLIAWAQQIAYLPLRLVEVVARVAFPLFSRMQYDRDTLARVFERTLQFCAAGVFFTSALLLTAGGTVTRVVFSAKWLDGLVGLYAFSAALTIGFISPVVGAVLDALGRPGIIARLAAGWTVLNWIVTPIATWRWGLNGFVLGYCVHIVVGNLAVLAVLGAVIPGARLARPLAAPGAGAVAAAAVGWFVLRPWAVTPLRLAAGVAAALLAYLAAFALVDRDALEAGRKLLGGAREPV